MNENQQEVTLTDLLAKYHLLVTDQGKAITINASGKSSASIKNYLSISVVLAIIGIVCLFFSTRLGFIFLVGMGASLVGVMNLRQREKEAKNRTVTIGEDCVEIKEGFRREKISREEMAGFKQMTKIDNQVLVGSIDLIKNNNMPYRIIEVFDKKEHMEELASDLDALVEYFNDQFALTED